jgi:poly-gamma-glutamate synthesis protein (capsule biosynthesis protein)
MDRNDIPPADKEYNFKTHPNGVRAMMKAGFNLFSIANNHIIDYGEEGIRETLKWLTALGEEGTLHFAGAGKNLEEANTPAVFTVKGVKVAFAAVGMSGHAGKKSAGTASAYAAEPVLRKLKESGADIRILSVHAGKETESQPNSVQLSLARTAVADYGVQIVIGHHAHVVQGIEWYKGGLIFYGMGNFSMRGARNMGSVPDFHPERDFGLLAKVHMVWDDEKKQLTFKKLEAIPVYDMHSGPHPFAKEDDARARIDALNRLSGSGYLGKGHDTVRLRFVEGKGEFRFADEPPADQAAPAEEKKDAGKKDAAKKDGKKAEKDKKKGKDKGKTKKKSGKNKSKTKGKKKDKKKTEDKKKEKDKTEEKKKGETTGPRRPQGGA